MLIQPDLGLVPTLARGGGEPKEMLSVRRDDGGKTYVKINYSSLSIILTCMRKSQLSLAMGLRSKSESPALIFGTAVHKALEIFYREPVGNRQLPSNFALTADLMVSHNAEHDQPHFLYRAIRAFLNLAEPMRMLPERDKRSLQSGIWTLVHYFTTYIDDPFVVCADAKGPITERTCEALLYDSPELAITFFGTIDVVLRNVKTNVVLPSDHKTFSSHAADFFKRCKPNLQYSGYIWLAQECLGLDVNTFMVNGVEVKARPVTARGSPPNFPRQVTRRTSEDLEEFKESVVWGVKAYVAALEGGVWVQGDVNACAMYNGCQFQQVCEVPRSIRPNVIEANFNGGL